MYGLFGGVIKGANKKKFKLQIDNQLFNYKVHENELFTNTIVDFSFRKGINNTDDSEYIEIILFGDPIYKNLLGEKSYTQLIYDITNRYHKLDLFKDVDGVYNAIIFDKIGKKLFLITDRKGLGHIYYGVFNKQLIWGSNLEYFLKSNYELSIRKESIEAFLEFGCLLKNETWFNQIYLLPPASYIEWDFNTSKLSIHQYWNPLKTNVNTSTKYRDIVFDISDLIKEAVKKRVGNDERIGITLSGGLDSRVIFSSLPSDNAYTAITRGMVGCGDIKLASQLTKYKNDVNHIIADINEQNWLNGRFEAINYVSGQKDIFNMNAISSLFMHKKYFDINLDGAWGAIYQSSKPFYEKADEAKLRFLLSRKYFANKFHFHDTVLNEVYKYYKLCGCFQYFFINQRMRRHTVFGSILGHQYGISSRFPLLDNNLQDYIYQLDFKTRLKDYSYNAFIDIDPYMFKNIDNLSTESKIYSNMNINILIKVIKKLQRSIGIEKYVRRYHDYPRWLLSDNYQPVREKYLFPSDSPLYDVVDKEKLFEIGNMYCDKMIYGKVISRIITLNKYFIDRF